MKMLVRAALALSAFLALTPAMAQTLYTVQVSDPNNPSRAQVRVTTTVGAAAALVQAGVAMPLDPSQYSYLANYPIGVPAPSFGTLNFGDPTQSAFIL